MSQTDLTDYQKIDILDGLAQNTVTDIYQDNKGFLWFGTTDGLSRFDGKNFANFICDINNENTLSNNLINVIREDNNDNLYIGTEDGLNIYERKTQKFSRIYRDTTSKISLPNNNIYALEIDSKNRLWVGTYDGLVIYDLRKKTFTKPQSIFGNSFGLDTALVLTLYKDTKDNLWIGTYKDGFFKYNFKENKLKPFIINDEKEFAYLNNTIYKVYEDKYSNIWLATNNGIAKLDNEHLKIKRYLHSSNPTTLQNSIYFQSIIQTSEGRLLVGSGSNGMYEYDYNNDKFNPISIRKNESGYLSGKSYASMLEDKSGVLWLGTTNDGVLKINLRKKPFNWLGSNQDAVNSLIGNSISDIIEDSDGKIWVATEQGLSAWDKRNQKTKHFIPSDKTSNTIQSNDVLSLFEDSKKNIWIGTSEGIDVYNVKQKKFNHYYTDFTEENQLPDNVIFGFCEDENNEIWIATSYGLSRFNIEENKFTNYFHSSKDTSSLPANGIWTIHYDSKHNIWVGTDNGIAKYIPSKNQFERYNVGPINEASRAQQEVIDIEEDENGIFWVATSFHGVVRFDPKTGKTKQFSIIHKFATNTVYAVKNYKEHIWFASVKGIGRLNKATGEIITFNHNDGIKSNEFNTPSLLTSDSILVFGGTNGITYFKPEEIAVDDYKPPIVFTELKINFKEILPGQNYKGSIPLSENINSADKIELNYDDNVFSITFSSLDYKIQKKIEYAYKIVGINEEWIELGNENTINFTGLRHGKYTLIVRASNSDGVWNKFHRSLTIIIKPPWWKTFWFISMLIVFFILLIAFIVKVRERRLQSAKVFLELNVQERTKKIGMQKEEIESQKEVIEKQNRELKHHTLHLEDEIEKRLADLIVARNKAEESDRLKSAFLSNMSHEIRTPLNAIIGFSELLEEHDMDKEKQSQFLEIIKNNSNDLLSLFDKLIDVSVIQSKKLTLKESAFNPNEILNQLYIDYERKIRVNSKKIELHIHQAMNGNDFNIINDAARLKQVLGYLISNAIKYTEKGRIDFGYNINKTYLEFFVKDTGIGIPKDKQFTLFNQFAKLEYSKEKVYRGTGLGLTISKDLVKLMGGKIWVDSKENEGTCFYFTLPINTSKKYREAN